MFLFFNFHLKFFIEPWQKLVTKILFLNFDFENKWKIQNNSKGQNDFMEIVVFFLNLQSSNRD